MIKKIVAYLVLGIALYAVLTVVVGFIDGLSVRNELEIPMPVEVPAPEATYHLISVGWDGVELRGAGLIGSKLQLTCDIVEMRVDGVPVGAFEMGCMVQ